MMQDMITFSIEILNAVSYFLGSEPIIYLFALILFCVLMRGVRYLF